MIGNDRRLQEAMAIALADVKFMGNTDKVNNAIDALTPKSTVTATFKRLQNNAVSDFLVKKDAGNVGYTEETRAAKIQEYMKDKFKRHMDDPKTSAEATKLFNTSYPGASDQDAE
jgi:hypothetical protein